MSAFLDKVLERPKSQLIGIWIGSLAVITFVFWQYFYSVKSRELVETEDKRDSLNTQISQEQRLASSLPKFRKEVKALRGKKEFALKQLPERREIPGLLDSIATLAKTSGLEVKRFAPKTDVIMDFYAAVPVQVEMRGTYHQIATFFDELSGLSRIVNVNDIKLTNPQGVEEDANVQVDSSCTITTFRYLEENERVQIDSAKDDKKKHKDKAKAKKGKKDSSDE